MSRPIIEHSTDLLFSPNPVSHPWLESDCETSGLRGVFSSGMWANVDDFGWHRCDTSIFCLLCVCVNPPHCFFYSTHITTTTITMHVSGPSIAQTGQQKPMRKWGKKMLAVRVASPPNNNLLIQHVLDVKNSH